jgi:hypothetical protein
MIPYTILVVAVVLVLIYFFVIRKKPAQPPPPPPPKPSLHLLNIDGAVTLKVGEFFRIEYEVLNGDEIVSWYVQPDPTVPIGGPDLACVYALGSRLSAYAPGTRKVYAMFASNPTVRVAEFMVTVVP